MIGAAAPAADLNRACPNTPTCLSYVGATYQVARRSAET